MSQPKWKHVASLGDVDPIAYGGAFIYVDETGVYRPEMTWFEPAPDSQWDRTGRASKLQIYRFSIERDTESEWWYKRLPELVASSGQSLEELQAAAKNPSALYRAGLYETLVQHFGAEEFDSYPLTMTEDEAYVKYAEEMKFNQMRGYKFS